MKHILFSITLFIFLLAGSAASAQSGLFRFIDQDTLEKGYTFSYEQGAFQLVIPARALDGPSDVSIAQEYTKERGALVVPTPDGMTLASDVYSYTLSDDVSITQPLDVIVTLPSQTKLAALYQYKKETKQWERMSTVRGNAHIFRASIRSRAGIVAVLKYRDDDAQLSALFGSSRALLVGDTQYHTYVAQNTNEILPLASLTKLMTALVFLDARVPGNKKITITHGDDTEPAKIPFAVGDVVTANDLFMSMLIGSKNNAAKALARSTGMSEQEFVKKMNQKARNFGMTQTTFADVTGLDSHNQSTARDYYRLARVALQRAEIKHGVQTRSTTVKLLNRKKIFYVRTTDELLDGSKSVYGKTGYTREAGYNLALLAEQEGKPIIVVVLGAPSSDQRFDLAGAIVRHQW